MTGMRDVAALAQVSAKTVSRVFNGDSHVAPETRKRVEAALRELNYVPNSLATTFRAGRSPVIGIAVPDLVDPFFGSIAKAVGRLATENGMSIVVTDLGDDQGRERVIVESLLRQSLSGLIIAPISHDQSYLAAWTSRTPVVFVDRAPNRVRADSFVEDDHAGAYLATEHLIGHGHQRIAFLGDTIDIPTTSNRSAGYRAALAAHHITFDPALVALGAMDRVGAAAALARLEVVQGRPTALFSSNARCTMALVPALAHGNLAVAAFGDFPMADVLSPAITVIDQDPILVGHLAGQRIIDRGTHPGRRYRRRTVLPVSLIERQSCRVTDPDTQPTRPSPVHDRKAG
jgi:LacI family transcriptional regulator